MSMCKDEAADILEYLPFVTTFSVKEREAIAIAVKSLRETQEVTEDEAVMIEVSDFKECLEDRGWREFRSGRKGILIYQKAVSDSPVQINIPKDRRLSDYTHAMKEAVKEFARVEGLSVNKAMRLILKGDTQ